MGAEFLAIKALALATLRRFGEAIEACDEAVTLSQTIEPAVLVACGRAIIGLGRASRDAESLAQHAFELALDWGNLDSFVCAYRSYPLLLGAIAGVAELERPLRSLVVRANDLPLARRAGLELEEREGRWQLTKREIEILDLLAQGLTNKEIAEHLFLAESTVKVHVRHILRKLGVRSRTEAAIRATTSGD